MSTFGFETTALEVVEGVDLSGKRALVTGGASGIGIETVRALAKAGAEVTIAARDVDAGEQVATETGALNVAYLDLAKLESVEAFARGWDGPLHILVNNAGVMAIQELTLNDAGLEMQFATNHVGHFALAHGLHGALAAEGARIVSRQLERAPALAGDLRRPQLRVPRLRPVVGLRAGQDRERAVRGRRDRPLGARRDLRQRADAGRDRDQPAAPHGPEPDRAGQGRGHARSRRPSRAPRRRSCWRPRRSSRASAAATTRTAPRRRSSSGAASRGARRPPTRWTPTTPTACGSCRSGCLGARARVAWRARSGSCPRTIATTRGRWGRVRARRNGAAWTASSGAIHRSAFRGVTRDATGRASGSRSAP